MLANSFVSGFAVGAFFLTAFIIFIGFGYFLFRPWIKLKMSGGRGSIFHVLGMRLRGTPPILVIDAYTSLIHSGVDVNLFLVESQYVANRTKIITSDDLIRYVNEYKENESKSKSN